MKSMNIIWNRKKRACYTCASPISSSIMSQNYILRNETNLYLHLYEEKSVFFFFDRLLTLYTESAWGRTLLIIINIFLSFFKSIKRAKQRFARTVSTYSNTYIREDACYISYFVITFVILFTVLQFK